MNITFGQLLKQLLNDRDISLSYFYRELNNLGVDVSYHSLYAYYSMTSCPKLETAKKIVRCQKLSITDSELYEILKTTKESISKSKENDFVSSLTTYIRINPRNIDKKYKNNAAILRNDIKSRINEMFGESEVDLSSKDIKKFSAYITRLIKDDLKKSNYI